MQIKLFKHQLEALTAKEKFICLLSGIGGGKTWTGAHWSIKNAKQFPKTLGFIGANTYGQLRDATLKALFNELDHLGITYTHNQSTGYLSFLGAEMLCKSVDNYEMLRGAEFGWAWLDEAAYMKREAFDVIVGRLRAKKSPLQILLTTTPKGFNWVYDHFHPSGEKNSGDYKLIRAKSTDNIFLPDGYIDSIKSQFDEKLAEQELLGEFVNLTQGKCYYAFDNQIHVSDEIEMIENSQIWVGLDFNVDPMTAVITQIYDNKIHVIGEVFLRNSNTYEIAKLLYDNFGSCTIVADTSGDARKTSGMTDFEILKQHGHRIIYTRKPFVIDRVNNMNRLFKLKQIIISSKCKKTINDLEKVSWKEGITEIDKNTDKLLTHLTDGLGYLAYYTFPMFEKRPTKTIQL